MNCIKCRKEIPVDSVFCLHCGKKQSVRKPMKRPNGCGTVYKETALRDSPWRAVYSHTCVGKMQRITVGYYKTKTDALNALDNFKPSSFYNYTIEEAFKDISKSKSFLKLTQSSVAGYQLAFNKIAPLHKKSLRNLRKSDMQPYIDAEEDKGLSYSTSNQLRLLFSKLCQFGMEKDILHKNYSQFLDLKSKQAVNKEVFTPQEIDAIYAKALYDDDTAKIVIILIYTGLRISELFEITLANTCEKYITGGMKTASGKNRTIPLHSKIQPFVMYFKDQSVSKRSKNLISSTTGSKIDSRNFTKRNYNKLMHELGIVNKSPHCTRHTAASELARQGVPPEIIVRILGHVKFEFTDEVYIKKTVDELCAEVEKLKFSDPSSSFEGNSDTGQP